MFSERLSMYNPPITPATILREVMTEFENLYNLHAIGTKFYIHIHCNTVRPCTKFYMCMCLGSEVIIFFFI